MTVTECDSTVEDMCSSYAIPCSSYQQLSPHDSGVEEVEADRKDLAEYHEIKPFGEGRTNFMRVPIRYKKE